jgi:CBS domain containing-hemolysin-like protein
MVLLGLVLLVVSGIFLAARFALFSFQIAAGKGGVVESFGKGAELTRGATGQLAATLAALVVFNLLGAAFAWARTRGHRTALGSANGGDSPPAERHHSDCGRGLCRQQRVTDLFPVKE